MVESKLTSRFAESRGPNDVTRMSAMGQRMNTTLFRGEAKDKVTLSEFFFPFEVITMRKRGEERRDREKRGERETITLQHTGGHSQML